MATRKIKTPGEQVQTEADDMNTQTLPAPAAQSSTLPRASDIDPFTITRSVLTQDGWVCPA